MENLLWIVYKVVNGNETPIKSFDLIRGDGAGWDLCKRLNYANYDEGIKYIMKLMPKEG